ncbi:uncharacterized protein CEXT_288311 [Caerostris extrusa]|uniref:Uncharacterized protein n=1 Tax=Caerostris extrusa TaxID=172846 RepID=A0AAV4MN88_CAEEX|nr:uncharacterized protein CEXT_288311 [Caerostris extrusa]
MEEKELNTDILDFEVEDFCLEPERKKGKRKRSSILKQTKTLNLDICESMPEFDETEHRRRSQNIKRVSFADTFQVKELHTGNIYDIPGHHELTALQKKCSKKL